MQSFKDLDIYKLSHQLAIEIHQLSLEKLPKFEMFEEGTQIRRSSKSVVSNIVEGYGRKQYQQEFARYLTYALASVDETKEHLTLLFDSGSLKDEKIFQKLTDNYEQLGRMIYSFRESVRQNSKDLS